MTAATTVVDVRTTAKSHQSLQRDSFNQKTRKETSGFFLEQDNGTKEFKASGSQYFSFLLKGLRRYTERRLDIQPVWG